MVIEKFAGKIVSGRKLGTKMGFPTLNMDYEGSFEGVFAGRVCLDGARYFNAAIHVGPRPTIDDERRVCEAFLFDFDGNVGEGDKIEVELVKKVRDIVKFNGLDELKVQIALDVEEIKNILA